MRVKMQLNNWTLKYMLKKKNNTLTVNLPIDFRIFLL
jgi:hypothetical protein